MTRFLQHHLEYWLWSHRRWKYKPEDVPGDLVIEKAEKGVLVTNDEY